MFCFRFARTLSLVTVLAVCAFSSTLGEGQQATPASADKLTGTFGIRAALVLSSDFCTSKAAHGSFWTNGKDTFFIGKLLCARLESGFSSRFTRLVRVEDASSPGNAQVIFIPKIVNVSYASHFRNDDLAVQVEWTVKDSSGKILYVSTAQGRAKDEGPTGVGSGNPHGDRVYDVVNDAVDDVIAQSVTSISSAPELHNLLVSDSPNTDSRIQAAIGTEVALQFEKDLSWGKRQFASFGDKDAYEGDKVDMVLSEDVRAGDAVVIKAGSKAVAWVTHARNSSLETSFLIKHVLAIRIDYLLVDDVPVRVGDIKGTGSAFAPAVMISMNNISRGTVVKVKLVGDTREASK
jgi:hypothetical protein